MADTDEKKAKKPEKPQRPAKAEPGASKAAEGRQRRQRRQGGKGGKGGKARRRQEAADGKAGKPAAPREPEPRVPARLKVQFEEAIRGKLAEQFGYKNRMQMPVARQDRHQHGHRRGRRRPQEGGVGRRRSRADRRAEGGDHQGAQVDRHLQAARRPGDRLQGDAAQGAHVRVPRPADQHRAAAGARFPRPVSPKSFDGRGNYTLGIKEHIVFPEIDYDKAAEIWGMDITVCTTARNDDEARALLTAFNFPFRQ